MYGYFDYKKAYLKNNERTAFMCYYCRLCYCLWNKGGQKARFLTTYDATIYNLILAIAGYDTCPPSLPCERIKANNKKYFKHDKIGSIITDLAIIGFAIKVKDDEVDGDGKRAFFVNLFFKRLLKKTIERHQEIFDKAYAAILDINKLQRENAPIGDVLSCYGKIMEDSFHYFFDIDEKYLCVFNAIARWSFLIDMIDDYNDDIKKNAPNSLYRDGVYTIKELFQKHYYEFIPIVQSIANDLERALQDIQCEKTEWIILSKILRHSLATLIPNILNGEDVKYHYFKDTVLSCKNSINRRNFKRKYEKNSVRN